MSAQGGTLRAPIQVPIRRIVATLLAAAVALGIGLGVRELVQEPARSGASVAELDWGSQLGHPQIRHGEPAEPAQVGFQSHQQI
jgi:hypothetical protein